MEQQNADEKERSLLHLEQANGKTENTVNVRRTSEMWQYEAMKLVTYTHTQNLKK